MVATWIQEHVTCRMVSGSAIYCNISILYIHPNLLLMFDTCSMKRVKAGVNWTLFDPREAPGLDDVYGEAFDERYHFYESNNMGRMTLNARHLWRRIINSQIETGGPFMLYKDAINRNSFMSLR
jgi:ribonucleotide reductase alpha subunit